jgi:ribosomal RNA-processing protein 12
MNSCRCCTQVVATLVSEIVLCTKEVNQKTRAAAYSLLVGLGRAMQAAQPPAEPDLDARMGGLGLQPGAQGPCFTFVGGGRLSGPL